ncbi:DUF1800 family protein [Aquimarina sp. RZ0]|uniref:DUF1800 domain-containing protein n=1 Tax=Aquimarina sp. RZ0 TaxID=2607730 RepID=UPI0011F320FF|nr:DUF1800 domain-containing protein [Aquimarina sp. RZ0]KAA1247948.1 DUF1800 domain-containing protein [Aquimarina sp. RZ0]
MHNLSDKEIQHLYWRTGFGITSVELKTIRNFSKEQIIEQLFYRSKEETPLYLDLKTLEKDPKTLPREERQKLRKLRNEKMLELSVRWLTQLTSTEQTLREKLTLFFHDHFAVRLKSPRACLHLNNIIRKHALGNFGEMLLEVSKSPAMLLFLNNRQNRKDRPNENFAREVMELFTLGRDNGYTEKDIKEAARAFTGWNFNKEGLFVFRKNHHDNGTKTFLGKTGRFTGEDIIKIILEEKQTARYITEKIYRYFINDKINAKHIEELTDIFYNANYNLEILLKKILHSNWFYTTENIGVKIKSPVELIVGINKAFDVTYTNSKVLIYLQRKLNQLLFFPPNVAGWPGRKTWIDNSTLMLRMKLASVILNNGVIEWYDQNDTPESIKMKQNSYKKRKSQIEKKVKTQVDWNTFLTELYQKDKESLIDFIIQPTVSMGAAAVISTLKAKNTKNFIIELMSLPEYQLC